MALHVVVYGKMLLKKIKLKEQSLVCSFLGVDPFNFMMRSFIELGCGSARIYNECAEGFYIGR